MFQGASGGWVGSIAACMANFGVVVINFRLRAKGKKQRPPCSWMERTVSSHDASDKPASHASHILANINRFLRRTCLEWVSSGPEETRIHLRSPRNDW